VLAVVADPRGPVDDAKVRARVTVPRMTVADAQKKFAAKIKQQRLPKELLEPRLTERQRALVAFSAFAMSARDRVGGLLDRTTVEVELVPVGGGSYAATIDLPAAGGVDVDVTADGTTPGGHAWRRRAQASGLIAVK